VTISLAEKVALIYTSAGSLRRVADLAGLDHRRVGRILRAGGPGGYKTQTSNSAVISAIDHAFSIHTHLCRKQAHADKLPFTAEVPIYIERLIKSDGKPGERVACRHTEHISPELRERWIEATQAKDFYIALSVLSLVNLEIYVNRGDSLHRGKRTPLQKEYRKNFKRDLSLGKKYEDIATRYVNLSDDFDYQDISDELNQILSERHEPACDEKSKLAREYLLQAKPKRKSQNATKRHRKGKS
jgi:hypothetical protein